jgi:hypothetical protein
MGWRFLMVSCVENVLDLFKFMGSDKAVEF